MATEDVNVKIKVSGDTKKVDKSLKKTQTEFKKTEKSAKKAFGANLFLGASAAIFAIGAAIKSVTSAASKFEDIGVQFEVLTGSVKVAQQAMEELSAFSAGTPFQFEEIAEAGKKLLGFGFSVNELTPRLTELGDVAAALGTPLNELALIYGQVSAAGKLTGERLLQFQERAIPIGPAIAKTLGVAESSIKDLVSKGGVDFETFQKAFASLSEEGGVAFGGLEKKSKTLSGKISTLKDNFILLQKELGDNTVPLFKDLTDNLIMVTKYWTRVAMGADASEASLSTLTTRLEKVNEQVGILERKRDKNKGSWVADVLGTNKETFKQLGAFYAEASTLETRIEQLKEKLSGGEDEAGDDKAAAKLAAIEAARTTHQESLLEMDAEFAALSLEAAEQKILDIKELEDQAKIEKLESENKFTEALALTKDKRLKDTIALLTKEKKADEVVAKNKKKLADEEVANRKVTLGSLAALTGSHNSSMKAIGKAASIVQIGIATQEGAIKAYKSLAGVALIGPALGAAAAGAIIAFGAERASRVAGLNEGGIVTGGFAGRDSVPAMLTPGELVVPQQNFDEVISAVSASRGEESGGVMEHVISFTDDAFEIIESKLIERQALGIA